MDAYSHQDAKNTVSSSQKDSSTVERTPLSSALWPELFLKNLQRLEEENRMLKLRLQQQQELMSEGFLAFQQSAEELRIKIKGEAQNYLAHIFESLPIGVIVTSPSGYITAINQAGAAMLGYSTPQLLGKSAKKLLKLTYSPKTAIEKNTHQQTITWQTTPEEARTLHISISPLLGNGNPLGFLLNLEDLTLITKLKQESQRQERLAAMGQVAAHIAHEIRNPLGSIGLFTDLVKKNLSPENENQSLLSHVSSSVSNMNQILTNLLQYTKPPQNNLLKINVQPLLSDIIEFHRGLAYENKITLKVHLSKQPQLVLADNVQLRQCLQNLLINAIQAAKSSSQISIHAKNKIIRSSDKISPLTKATPVCEIKFINQGGHIPLHIIKQLFDPFFSTKTHGTGLGLTIAQQIVHEHRGDILAENIHQGTCFTVRLPICKPHSRATP